MVILVVFESRWKSSEGQLCNIMEVWRTEEGVKSNRHHFLVGALQLPATNPDSASTPKVNACTPNPTVDSTLFLAVYLLTGSQADTFLYMPIIYRSVYKHYSNPTRLLAIEFDSSIQFLKTSF